MLWRREKAWDRGSYRESCGSGKERVGERKGVNFKERRTKVENELKGGRRWRKRKTDRQTWRQCQKTAR